MQPSTAPPASTDPQLILKLASIGATEDEICTHLNITPRQIRQLCGDKFAAHQAWFKIILRQKQFEYLIRNPASNRMLIWLGQCYLNQPAADDDDYDDDYADTLENEPQDENPMPNDPKPSSCKNRISML